MTKYIGFLRAVNVGGTGKISMETLRDLCAKAGFKDIQTYIQSGNVLFESELSADAAKNKLELKLHSLTGKHIGVHIRTPGELQEILDRNPYTDAEPNKVAVLFLDHAPSNDFLSSAKGLKDERMSPMTKEIVIHYPSGIGGSKMKIKSMETGTARNLNTLKKILEIATDDK